MHETRTPQLHVRVCYITRESLPAVLDVERQAFGQWCWNEQDFILFLRQRNAIGMTAELNNRVIVGHMLYLLHERCIELVNFVVHPKFQRAGVGTQMMGRLKCKLAAHRRNRLDGVVPDSLTWMHLFLRTQGFRATRVLRSYFEDSNEDGYRFVYRIRKDS